MVTLGRVGMLAEEEQLSLFNDGFSGYLVPLKLDREQFREHNAFYDIDLEASPTVLVNGVPSAFAMVAVRGVEAWIGGMGTVPDRRRQGLARMVMTEAIASAGERGCERVGLEVIAENARALGLYRQLGFVVDRDIVIWTLAGGGSSAADGRPSVRTCSVDEALSAAGEDERGPVPWQLDGPTLEHMCAAGIELGACVAEDGHGARAAAVFRERADRTAVLRIGGDPAAVTALLSHLAAGREIQILHVPAGSPISEVLVAIGATAGIRQHQMSLRLGSGS